MTFTPDRKRRKSNRRARRADSDSRSDAGNRPKIGPSSTPSDASSLREQLRAAGLDLTGHPFVEVFDALDPVPAEPLEPITQDSRDAGNTADDDADSPPWSEDAENDTTTPVPPTDLGDDEPAWEDDEPAREEASDDAAAAQEFDGSPAEDPPGWDDSFDGGVSPWTSHEQPTSNSDPQAMPGQRTSRHPLLPDTTWSDLADCAPEITDAITSLSGLDEQLRAFDRPMGPNEALHVIDGAEALRRLSDSLSTLALSVYERIGTPTDSGAKTPKDLIQSRLNLTGREANRRARLAENLGGRVTLDGQRLEPEHPLVAEQFHLGTLSAEHITALEECLKALPAWVDQATKDKAEADLVRYAADVTVNELRDIFRHMLVRIDPDGAEPLDAKERSAYFVTARPKRNGDWRLEGVLDPVAGSELHGLLTSRIESTLPAAGGPATDPATAETDPAPSGATPGTNTTSGAAFGPDHNRNEEPYAPVDAVFAGDRLDAPQWAVFEANRDSGASQNPPDATTALPDGYGVREDGSTINLVSEQPTAKSWIYERFATLISRISMKEAQKGSPYALVVTAKASDLANNIGEATTGSGARFPMDDLTRRGLNGTVFFHLMDDKAKTVAVETENRFADKKQTAVITARDRGCVFPGCDAPAGWCDVNHVVPHSEGGRTNINNMCLVCSFHHHLMDRSGWEVVMLADGRPAWKPPESIDPTRTLVLHSRFITDDIVDSLFDF